MKIMDDPFPETPGQKESAKEKFRSTVASWPGVSQEFKDLALSKESEFVTRTQETAHSGTHFYGGQLGWSNWVIKNDELNLLGQLGPAATGIVAFLAVANAPVAVMAFGLVLSVAGIAKKLKTKSILLDNDDYNILMALKEAGPSTVSRIAEVLSGTHIYGAQLWDETRTLAALNKLKLVPQTDGVTVPLVNESSDGRWSVSGI